MYHHQLTPGVCLISLGRVWSILLTGEVCRDEAASSYVGTRADFLLGDSWDVARH